MDDTEQKQQGSDLKYLRDATGEMKQTMEQVRGIVGGIGERLAALEATRAAGERDYQRMDKAVSELYQLHREAAENLTNWQTSSTEALAAIRESIATLKISVSHNTKHRDRWLTMLFSIAGSVTAALVISLVVVNPSVFTP